MEKLSNVTVIIPCFNDGLYVEEALLSIQNQTLKAEKIIVVDDGSNAATKDILKALKINDLEIIFQNNQGVSAARNNGIQMASTKYVLNLDADDILEPTFIEKSVKVLNENLTVGVVGSYCQLFSKTNKSIDVLKPLGGGITNFLIKNNVSANSMFRKLCWEQVNGFDTKMLNGYEDWEFWISVTSKNWSVHVLEEVLMYYRIKNTSRDQNALINHDYELRCYIFDKHKDLYRNHFDFCFKELMRRNSTLKLAIEKIKKTNEFLVGDKILKPIRVLKNVAFQIINKITK